MRQILLSALAVCCAISVQAQDTTANSLWEKYQALPTKQQRLFLKKLTADQQDQFVREIVQDTVKGRTREEIRKNWEHLVVATGDEFERWGEKLLEENRRLTRQRILELLNDPKRDFAWRVAFHSYFRVIFDQTEPRDAYEIGLTKDEVAKLRDEIPKIKISAPTKADAGEEQEKTGKGKGDITDYRLLPRCQNQ